MTNPENDHQPEAAESASRRIVSRKKSLCSASDRRLF